MSASVKNAIVICLASGNLDKEKLSKITGIGDNELQIFLEKLINENKIKEGDGVYSLVNQK